MTRENLDDIPDCALPAGYAIRWYQSGDEVLWLRIQSLADKLPQFNNAAQVALDKLFESSPAIISELFYENYRLLHYYCTPFSFVQLPAIEIRFRNY